MAKGITLKTKNGGTGYPKSVTDLIFDNATGKTLKTLIDELKAIDAATDTRTQFYKASVTDLDALNAAANIGTYNYVGNGWRGLVQVCLDHSSNVAQVALSSSSPSYDGNVLSWIAAQPCAMARVYRNGAWSHWEKVGAPVVNDLTTGGTEKALSAEMGKTLKEGLDALGPKIEQVSDILDVEEGIAYEDESIIDYTPSGNSNLQATYGFWANINSKSLPNRSKEGVLKEIRVSSARTEATTFYIKLYKKVWNNGIISRFTEVPNSEHSFEMPANTTTINVLSSNIVIEGDVVVAIKSLARYGNAGTGYGMNDGQFSSSYAGNFELNVDYIVQFPTTITSSARLNDIEEALANVADAKEVADAAKDTADESLLQSSEIGDALNMQESSKDLSIIDYTPYGAQNADTDVYWAVIHSKTMPDRKSDGILKEIRILSSFETDTTVKIKLIKKVWSNGQITGFTSVADGEYTFTFPANTTSLDVSAQGIEIGVDVIIEIKAPIKYDSAHHYPNYCISNGNYLAAFDGNFSINVDYIVTFITKDSERINNIESNIDLLINHSLSANVVCLGDSITWLGGDDCDGRQNPSRGWTTYFKDMLNPTSIRSYARSGATWSHTENTAYDIVEDTGVLSDDNVIYNQINRLIAAVNGETQVTPDLIIIAAGTNDAWYPNARPSATDVDADTAFSSVNGYILARNVNTLTNIAEAMRYDIELLKSTFPNCQIVVLTPLQSTKFTLAKCKAVGDIIEGCAEYLSVPCIRQDKKCGIYRGQESTANLMTYDGAHTSAIGAKCVGYYLASAIRSIYRGGIS